jgi:hypothetical protein
MKAAGFFNVLGVAYDIMWSKSRRPIPSGKPLFYIFMVLLPVNSADKISGE